MAAANAQDHFVTHASASFKHCENAEIIFSEQENIHGKDGSITPACKGYNPKRPPMFRIVRWLQLLTFANNLQSDGKEIYSITF